MHKDLKSIYENVRELGLNKFEKELQALNLKVKDGNMKMNINYLKSIIEKKLPVFQESINKLIPLMVQ